MYVDVRCLVRSRRRRGIEISGCVCLCVARPLKNVIDLHISYFAVCSVHKLNFNLTTEHVLLLMDLLTFWRHPHVCPASDLRAVFCVC